MDTEDNMDINKPELRRARLLKALDEDWQDMIMLTRMYFEHLSHEFDHSNVVNPIDWNEVKDSWLELQSIEGMYFKFKDLIIKEKYQEAIDMAEDVLAFPLPQTPSYEPR